MYYTGHKTVDWPIWVHLARPLRRAYYDYFFIIILSRKISYITFGLIILNAIPGLVIDFCRKKWNNEPKGAAIGISICFTLSFIFVCAGSILSGFQNETIAYVSIIGLV